MPTYASAGRIFDHQHVLQRGWREIGKGGSTVTDRQKKVRNFGSLLQTASIEVVTPTEGDDAPLAEKAVELELFESLLSQVANEILLFVKRDQCRFVKHAGGQFSCAFEQVFLHHRHGP